MIGKDTKITFPELFALAAHLSGLVISAWMGRWDLLVAGIAFGIPSFLLFHDLSPRGRGLMIELIRRIV